MSLKMGKFEIMFLGNAWKKWSIEGHNKHMSDFLQKNSMLAINKPNTKLILHFLK